MIRHLNTSVSADFPRLKTYAGALKRLQDFTRTYEQAVPPTNRTNVLTAVLSIDDRYVPAVVIGQEATMAINVALHCKCWVTNVV